MGRSVEGSEEGGGRADADEWVGRLRGEKGGWWWGGGGGGKGRGPNGEK